MASRLNFEQQVELLTGNKDLDERLRFLWQEEKTVLHLPKDELEAVEEVIKLIFNPSKKRSTRFSTFARLPTLSSAENAPILQLAQDSGLLLIVHVAGKSKFTLTPEAIMAIEVIGKENATGKLSFDDALLRLHDIYREMVFAKIVTGEKLRNLGLKHVAILLFLFLNGSIGTQRACVVDSYDTRLVIEKIVLSFSEGPDPRVRNTYSFNYYLVEAKEVLGDVIYNTAPRYYIQPSAIDYVTKRIREALQNVPDSRKRWEWMRRSYDQNSSFLRAHGISYFRPSEAIRLELRIFGDVAKRPGVRS